MNIISCAVIRFLAVGWTIGSLPSVALAAGSPSAAPDSSPCARVTARYAHIFDLSVEGSNKFRRLAIKGKPALVEVWGAARGPAAAAAALQHATLRHALRYDAVLRRQHYDICTFNDTLFAVAPVAYRPSSACGNKLGNNGNIQYYAGRSGDMGAVPMSAPLMMRAATGACRQAAAAAAAALRDTPLHKDVLRECALLTVLQFKKLLFLPQCARSDPENSSMLVVLASAHAYSTSDPVTLQTHFSTGNVSLTIIRFSDTSCFHKTLQSLYDGGFSFLFFDENMAMYHEDILSIDLYLKNDYMTERCPAGLNIVNNFTMKIGNGEHMMHYAPQIANFVTKFCPSFKDLRYILSNGITNKNMEENACKWILQNKETFEHWITRLSEEFNLYVMMCATDPLNNEYDKIINEVIKTSIENKFGFSTVFKKRIVNCDNHDNVSTTFRDIMKDKKAMGAIAWSFIEGIPMISKDATKYHMPLILAGPITTETDLGYAAAAVNGRLEDLAHAYRALLIACKWSRLAILSDESSFAKDFTKTLVLQDDFIYVKEAVTSKTVTNVLRSLKKDDARIFIVNTNSSLAKEVLQSAIQLDMTSNLDYTWIVREWSPAIEYDEGDSGSLIHYSLTTTWRGAAGGANDSILGMGDVRLRRRLDHIWPGAPWPSLAAPLADSVLLLLNSFSIFYQLYSSSTYNLTFGKYAIYMSQIYNNINVTGVANNIKFYNGSFNNQMVFLEKWEGQKRTILTSSSIHELTLSKENMAVCRVSDRPSCLLPASGVNFVVICYDPLLYALILLIILFPCVCLLIRSARLKLLEEHDRKLVASLLGTNPSPLIINRVYLHKHKEIGTGHFGRVYLATLRQPRNKTIVVAAKELWKECDKEQYLQEARILALLDHKNIVKFVGVCTENGSLVILMKYECYGDLLKYLRKRRHLLKQTHLVGDDERESKHISSEALSRLAYEAAAALEYLSQQGLVHRDIRAANCLIDEQRTLKLADFGMARKLNQDEQEYTTVRHALFPVLWMAPESLNYGKFSTASDMWALGVLIFELSTLGRRPYGDWPAQRVLTFVRLGGHPPLPPDTNPQTRSLVMACWQQSAAMRPSAADVARYLRREPRAVRPALLPAPAPRLF